MPDNLDEVGIDVGDGDERSNNLLKKIPLKKNLKSTALAYRAELMTLPGAFEKKNVRSRVPLNTPIMFIKKTRD